MTTYLDNIDRAAALASTARGSDLQGLVRDWANECCTASRDAVPGADLFASFAKWLPSVGEAPITERAFLLALARLGVPRKTLGGCRQWVGLTVNPEWIGDAVAVRRSRSAPGVGDYLPIVEGWILRHCELDPAHISSAAELYEEFVKHTGRKIGRNSFGLALAELPGLYRRRMILGRQQCTMWCGIAVKGSQATLQAPADAGQGSATKKASKAPARLGKPPMPQAAVAKVSRCDLPAEDCDCSAEECKTCPNYLYGKQVGRAPVVITKTVAQPAKSADDWEIEGPDDGDI